MIDDPLKEQILRKVSEYTYLLHEAEAHPYYEYQHTSNPRQRWSPNLPLLRRLKKDSDSRESLTMVDLPGFRYFPEDGHQHLYPLMRRKETFDLLVPPFTAEKRINDAIIQHQLGDDYEFRHVVKTYSNASHLRERTVNQLIHAVLLETLDTKDEHHLPFLLNELTEFAGFNIRGKEVICWLFRPAKGRDSLLGLIQQLFVLDTPSFLKILQK